MVYQRPVGQVVKTGASHAPNGSSTLPRVTILPLLLRGQDINLIVGAFNGEGPPVPIPNTEVKLTCADDTCLETGRENRSTPTQEKRRDDVISPFFASVFTAAASILSVEFFLL